MNSNGEQEVPEGTPPWDCSGDKELRWLKTFQKHMRGMDKLVKEMHKEYPRAGIYIDDGTTNLMIDYSHADSIKSREQQQFVVDEYFTPWGDGGGW